MNVRKPLKYFLIVCAIMLVMMQFIQPNRDNPPVDASMTLTTQLKVPSEVAALLERGCRDCHSNQTVWPFYSYIAPASWLVSYDVMEGRKHFNMSEWGKYKEGKKIQKLSGIFQAVSERSMPLPKYIPLHPEANFTDAERSVLSLWAQQEGERMMGGSEEETDK
ncbi:MAG: heme-binding domain-containing protein [Bacteriovoracaceae bacterium]|nr:heme-binding domain-containing protein [Bacteroidota bacterium]